MRDKIFIETKAEIAEEVFEIVEESMMKAFEGLLLSDPSKMDSNIQRASAENVMRAVLDSAFSPCKRLNLFGYLP